MPNFADGLINVDSGKNPVAVVADPLVFFALHSVMHHAEWLMVPWNPEQIVKRSCLLNGRNDVVNHLRRRRHADTRDAERVVLNE